MTATVQPLAAPDQVSDLARRVEALDLDARTDGEVFAAIAYLMQSKGLLAYGIHINSVDPSFVSVSVKTADEVRLWADVFGVEVVERDAGNGCWQYHAKDLPIAGRKVTVGAVVNSQEFNDAYNAAMKGFHASLDAAPLPVRVPGAALNDWEDRCQCGHQANDHWNGDGACRAVVTEGARSLICDCVSFGPGAALGDVPAVEDDERVDVCGMKFRCCVFCDDTWTCVKPVRHEDDHSDTEPWCWFADENEPNPMACGAPALPGTRLCAAHTSGDAFAARLLAAVAELGTEERLAEQCIRCDAGVGGHNYGPSCRFLGRVEVSA